MCGFEAQARKPPGSFNGFLASSGNSETDPKSVVKSVVAAQANLRLCRTIARVYHLPIEVGHKGIDILRCRRPIIHVKAVFIHIERDQWRACNSAVHVIRRPVIVQRLGVAIVG